MPLPNYEDGSIVNLASSISGAFGNPSSYKPLKALDSESLKGKNIVFVILDGLGYNALRRFGKDSFVYRNLRTKATSVFPSDTAACMASFFSARSVQQHAITGWFLPRNRFLTGILNFFPELNWFLSRLRMVWKGTSNGSFLRIRTAKIYFVAPSFFIRPWYDLFSIGNPYLVAYDAFSDAVNKVKTIILNDNERKYVALYCYKFDDTFHTYGTRSKKGRAVFSEVDKALESLSNSISGSNTTMIITADHGMVDTRKSELIRLMDHPELLDMLEIPPLGDSRVAYLYVRSSMSGQFEQYVRKELGKFCSLHRSEDLIKKGYFGLFEPNKELFSSVGNYTLIMKGNFAIQDLIHLNSNHKKAHHGALSEDEMYVPVSVIDC
jgi:hypothetical protein